MDNGGDHFAGGSPGGSCYGGSIDGSMHGSVLLGRTGTGSVKADEAYLLSQATATAMIAAKSIIMAGGTEETALKTAKAAAQSVLNPPGAADADSGISGRSNHFLRRRKAKRQAEVVASMALMSATSSMQSTANGDWETMSASSASQFAPRQTMQNPFNGYNTNITAQDDRSFISGFPYERERSHLSKLPPQSPRSKPLQSPSSKPPQSPMLKRVQNEQPAFEESRPPKPSKQASPETGQHPLPRLPSLSNRAPPAHDSAPLARESSERARLSKQIEQVQSRRKNLRSNLPEEDFSINNSHDSMEDQESVVVRSLNAGSSSSSSEESLDSMGTEDESVVNFRASKTTDTEQDFVKTLVDPVLFSFTNAFNAFNCGPTDMSSFMCEEDGEGANDERATRGKRKPVGVKGLKPVEYRDDLDANNVMHHDVPGFRCGDDEADFQDAKQEDAEELREVVDSCDHSEIQSAFMSSASGGTSRSHSSTSVDSEQLLSELNMSSEEEGEIQVRSSIRETMEHIVSKSQKNVKKYDASNTDVDRTWLTNELRQSDEESPEMTSTVQAPTLKTPTMNMDEAKGARGWFRTKREAAEAKAAAKKAKKREKLLSF